MIVRVVRMTFRENQVDTFLELFNHHKESIRNYPGCQHLELHQDARKSNIFCTYSHWESLEALDGYRHSDLFREVWPATKQLFEEKPEAFSNVVKQVI